ncbi:hypothetical protein fugu_011478 [Takifugu bimaculatus]|uniref:Uncharacterized protein n=1 Tax=Takifugu bimaculatus TaxID=433685 RepID=A0A4Z2C7P3_9TELE|nr:hypothetical protein fugu_011478 [Takifugu bimaculatus]
MSTLSSTSHISPGEILALYCVFRVSTVVVFTPCVWSQVLVVVHHSANRLWNCEESLPEAKAVQGPVSRPAAQNGSFTSYSAVFTFEQGLLLLSLLCRVHLTTSWTRVRGVNPEHMEKSQILLRCAQVDNRVQSLAELYDGPQPSDMCDLLEGEQFFAGFERGLDSQHRSEGLVQVSDGLFFSCCSHLLVSHRETGLRGGKTVLCVLLQPEEPEGGLHLCSGGSYRTCEGPGEKISHQPTTVSFYRGEIPGDLPEELARKRKGHDNQWLATLPVKLPAADSENGFLVENSQHPPLNLGDPESGYLTESNLLSISLQIGQDWRVVGINLGLSYEELDPHPVQKQGQPGSPGARHAVSLGQRAEKGRAGRRVEAGERHDREREEGPGR